MEVRACILVVCLAVGVMISSHSSNAQEPPQRKPAAAAGPGVVLVVDDQLTAKIRPGLNQFVRDLVSDGYAVYQKFSRFASPPELRTYLSELHKRLGKKLVGAILIGDQPRAYQYVTLHSGNPNIPAKSEEVISYQYYADLDGVFEASDGYQSPGKRPFSFDVHRGEMNWELWIGVLPMYRGDLDQTAGAINEYFTRNHAYRTGKPEIPRAFLEVNEHAKAADADQQAKLIEGMRSGPYSWAPLSKGDGNHFYCDTAAQEQSVAKGYADLSAGLADFAVVDAHGNWRACGKINVPWVEKNAVRTIFFWSNGCAVGDLDHPENFLTTVLYGPKSTVLISRGTTNDSGGMGSNKNGFFGRNIASAMAQGKCFGEAIVSHVNEPLLDPWAKSRELHFATCVVLGDPTLKLHGKD